MTTATLTSTGVGLEYVSLLLSFRIIKEDQKITLFKIKICNKEAYRL